MSENTHAKRDSSVADTIERVRSERFPDIDRDLVLEILRLHADDEGDNLVRAVEEAIAQREAEVN